MKNRSPGPAGLTVALAALALACILSGCGGPDGAEEVSITFSGPRILAVTPDSVHADPLKAPRCRFTSFTLTLEMNVDLPPGGGIRIEEGCLFGKRALVGHDMRYTFPNPVIHDKTQANYLSMEEPGVPYQLSLAPVGLGRVSPVITFAQGLSKGSAIVLHYGDTTHGSPGLAVPTYPMKTAFLTLLDRTGEGRFTLAAGDHPEVEVQATGADRLRISGPSITRKGKVRVKIVPTRGRAGLSSSALPVADYTGRVKIFADPGMGQVLGEAVFKKGDTFKEAEVDLPAPGLFRLTAAAETDGTTGASNPILYLKTGDNLSLPGLEEKIDAPSLLDNNSIFWGSLQNHTAVGGHATSHTDRGFEYARNQGALDFCAFTEHSSGPSFCWGELRALPDRHDKPGLFAAFAGYEWTSSLFGHRHIIFKDGKETKACSELPTEDPCSVHAPDLNSLAHFAGHDPNALLIVHHTRRILDEGVPHYYFGLPEDLPRQRLFEIFSWQGGNEGCEDDLPIQGLPSRTYRAGSGFRDAQRNGWFMGITSDSDGHLGMPGIPTAIKRKNALRYGYCGLTAVFSPTLDREGIFSGLENRRCYGTTGARILLLFRAGSAAMGGETSCPDRKIRIQALALGTAPLERIQVIDDKGKVVYETHPGQMDAALNVEVALEGKDEISSLYLRLDQQDGHRAWTSPIRLKP